LRTRQLLEHGALTHLVTHDGRTARDLAASHPLVLAELEGKRGKRSCEDALCESPLITEVVVEL
jgi:hypothetical protein